MQKETFTDQITLDIDENVKQIRFYKSKKGWHVRLFLKKPISVDEHFRKRIVMYDDLLRIKFDIEKYNIKKKLGNRIFDETENKVEIIKIGQH